MNITKLRLLARNHGVAGTLLAGAWLLWRTVGTRRRRFVLYVLTGAALVFLVWPVHCHMRPYQPPAWQALYSAPEPSLPDTLKQPLRVTFLDVGKGDAIVLETPSGKCLVVDAGGTLGRNDDRGRTVVAPFLRARKRKRIDLLLLTHPHPDHVGGAATLINQFPVLSLVDNGLDSTVASYKSYREAAGKRNVPCIVAARGWCMDCGDGVVLRALAPDKPLKDLPNVVLPAPLARRAGKVRLPQKEKTIVDTTGNREVNNSSVVLRVEYGKTSLLLTGDAEAESENEMLQSRQPLACDVLKVGHHGSNKSTSTRFLQAVKPRYAVISVDTDNRNGHPAPPVLERLQKAGAQIFRTDQHGNVTCVSDGRAVRVETSRPPAKHENQSATNGGL